MSSAARTVGVSAVIQVATELYPGAELLAVERPGGTELSPEDAAGLGEPLVMRLRLLDGEMVELLFQTADAHVPALRRRADRAARLLGSYDAFARVPRHARAMDVGIQRHDGSLATLRDSGEFYLVSERVRGRTHAEHLRTIAERGALEEEDMARVNDLAVCLLELHARVTDAPAYRHAARELFGGDAGVLAVIDGYPADTPGVPRMILEHFEKLVLPWRWKLRDYEHRSTRIHGALDPARVVWTEQGPRLLDADRRGVGDPADDLVGACLDFVMLGLTWPGTWKPCFRRLWNAHWNTYLGETGDSELLEVAAPFIARRALVLCSPVSHPGTPALVRERLLGLVEQILVAPRFDPALVESLFREEEPRSIRSS